MKNRLAEILKEQGRKQSWLASELDITAIHLNGICNNKFALTTEMAFKIKDLLGLENVEELWEVKK